MGIEPYNYPLWFLRSLFITYILYFIIRKATQRLSIGVQIISIFFISFIVYTLAKFLILPSGAIIAILHNTIFNSITAFIALPFFSLASLIKSKGILYKKISTKTILMIFIICFLVWTMSTQKYIDYMSLHFGKNFIFLYLSALAGTGCVWCIAYIIKKVFYISYIGRYSLIALGTHVPLILLFNLMGIDNRYFIVLSTFIIMPGIIYVFKKYFPYMTAQKDLFIYKNGKIHLSINNLNKNFSTH